MTDSGGSVSASYVIDVNSALIGDYELLIEAQVENRNQKSEVRGSEVRS